MLLFDYCDVVCRTGYLSTFLRSGISEVLSSLFHVFLAILAPRSVEIFSENLFSY
jgi:hypothetical protein